MIYYQELLTLENIFIIIAYVCTTPMIAWIFNDLFWCKNKTNTNDKLVEKSDHQQTIRTNVDTLFKHMSQDQVKAVSRKLTEDYSVAVINLNGDLNTGNIMRTACCCGCDTFYVLGKRHYDSRSDVGSRRYLNVSKDSSIVTSPNDKRVSLTIDVTLFSQWIEKNNIMPIFIEQGGESLATVGWNQVTNQTNGRQICFIFGNETWGIPRNVLGLSKTIPGSRILSIPQHNVMKSHNVSISAGIVLWDYYRSAILKPMYDKL